MHIFIGIAAGCAVGLAAGSYLSYRYAHALVAKVMDEYHKAAGLVETVKKAL